MAIQFMDIAGRQEFPIAGYAHFSDIILYPALPGTCTERVNTNTGWPPDEGKIQENKTRLTYMYV
jgi:hypothetical protein